MKPRFLINTKPVYDLKAWCKDKGLVYVTFRKAISRAKQGVLNKDGTWKKLPSNKCKCKGYFVEKL